MKFIRPQYFNQLTKSILLYIVCICVGCSIYAVYNTYSEPQYYDFVLQKPLNKSKVLYKDAQEIRIKDTLIDLNTAVYDDFLAVGFSKKQAKTICNYRNKGGVFYSKNDLLKIYGISQKQFEMLTPYVFVESNIRKIKKSKSNYTKPNFTKNYRDTIQPVEINTATPHDLMKIKGIGEFRAQKIIEYREKLGGFYNVLQLQEVYSIDSNLVATLKDWCYVDTSRIVKINLNTAQFTDLQSHPYCGYYRAKDIFNYMRIQKTNVQVSDLLHENILTNEEYLKLSIYLQTF